MQSVGVSIVRRHLCPKQSKNTCFLWTLDIEYVGGCRADITDMRSEQWYLVLF